MLQSENKEGNSVDPIEEFEQLKEIDEANERATVEPVAQQEPSENPNENPSQSQKANEKTDGLKNGKNEEEKLLLGSARGEDDKQLNAFVSGGGKSEDLKRFEVVAGEAATIDPIPDEPNPGFDETLKGLNPQATDRGTASPAAPKKLKAKKVCDDVSLIALQEKKADGKKLAKTTMHATVDMGLPELGDVTAKQDYEIKVTADI